VAQAVCVTACQRRAWIRFSDESNGCDYKKAVLVNQG